MFGLGASNAHVEVGSVENSFSVLYVDVYRGNGDLFWGGGLGVESCTGGLGFDDPSITVNHTPVVRLRCTEPDMQVSIRLLDEQISSQTDARVVVASTTDLAPAARQLTSRLSDVYPVDEPVAVGPDVPNATTVLYRPGFEIAAQGLAEQLTIDHQNAPTAPVSEGQLTHQADLEFDILIVLGTDFEPTE